MCYVNGRRVTDIGGIVEVRYNGSVLFSKRLFRRIVLVGDFGLAWSSDDGTSFTIVHIGDSGSLKAAVAGGGVVYVAGDGGFLARTDDLDAFERWDVISYDSSMNYIDLCAGGGSVIALAEGNKCSVSLAGGSFSTVSMPGANLGPMAYGNGVFVSPSGNYGGVGAYSADGGATWAESPVCATKRKSHSGYAPESYPCRNICFGEGYFFSSSGVYNSSSGNHYEYSYSQDGVNWQKVEMAPGAAASFCYRSATVYFNGLFYALEFREAHTVDPARISAGTSGRNLLWKMDNEKYAAYVCGDFALVASSGRYGAVENKLGVFRGAINDDACEFVRDIPVSGTIRGMVAV